MLSVLCKIGKSKWTTLCCYFIMIFGNGIISKTIHYSTSELQKHMELSSKELQGITVSASHILSIPLSLFITYIINKCGVTETIAMFQLMSFFGWLSFSNGVSNKSKTQMNLSRLIQGGANGAKRVAILIHCSCSFRRRHLSLSLGVLTLASKLSMIIGPLLIINIFMVKWKMKDDVAKLYFTSTIFVIPGVILSILVCVFTRYQDSENETDVVESISTDGSTTGTDNTKSNEAKTFTFSRFWNEFKILMQNRIFLLILLLCFLMEGSYAAFNGSLKQLLQKKYARTQEQSGFDMGLVTFFGILAPFTGYLVDKWKHRQLFIIFGAFSILFSHLVLAFVNRVIGLLGISFGLIIYANAFWPAIASVFGKEHQIAAYGLASAISSFGAVIIPMIAGHITDKAGIITTHNLFIGIYVFGFVLCILLTCMNYSADADYLNRCSELEPKQISNNDHEAITV